MKLHLTIAACLFAATIMVGCNILVPALYIVEGPPKTPAVTSLDSSKKTVIFIDDLRNNLPRRSLRQVIGEAAEQVIMSEGVVPEENMISSRSIMATASLESFGEPMSIVDAGRRVGAEIVVYVTIDGWTLSEAGAGLSPVTSMRMKVIDTLSDERLFPPTDRGFSFSAKLPVQAQMTVNSLSEKAALEQSLAEMAGLQLGKLFFESERDPMSTRTR